MAEQLDIAVTTEEWHPPIGEDHAQEEASEAEEEAPEEPTDGPQVVQLEPPTPEELKRWRKARKHSPKRFITLRRHPSFRGVEQESDWYWLWAAYAKGSFAQLFRRFRAQGLTLVEPETSRDLKELILEPLMQIPGMHWWLLTAPTRRGPETPVGLLIGTVHGTRRLEPYVVWFPWSSTRNRLESMLGWIDAMRRKVGLAIFAGAEDFGWWVHIERYGVLRHVGRWLDWDGEGNQIRIWQEK